MKNFLSLLQIADSALPIGSVAHSYGLETLIAENYVDVDSLEAYIGQLLLNNGKQEAWSCLQGYKIALIEDQVRFNQEWDKLHHTLSALRSAHELRSASEKIGRRLLQLVGQVEPHLCLEWAWQTQQTHQAAVWGLVGATLDIDSQTVTMVYLQQFVKTLVSAAQKLLPLGQTQATQIVWDLKPLIEQIAADLEDAPDEMPSAFPGLPEMAALRHPHLATRLFIS